MRIDHAAARRIRCQCQLRLFHVREMPTMQPVGCAQQRRSGIEDAGTAIVISKNTGRANNPWADPIGCKPPSHISPPELVPQLVPYAGFQPSFCSNNQTVRYLTYTSGNIISCAPSSRGATLRNCWSIRITDGCQQKANVPQRRFDRWKSTGKLLIQRPPKIIGRICVTPSWYSCSNGCEHRSQGR